MGYKKKMNYIHYLGISWTSTSTRWNPPPASPPPSTSPSTPPPHRVTQSQPSSPATSPILAVILNFYFHPVWSKAKLVETWAFHRVCVNSTDHQTRRSQTAVLHNKSEFQTEMTDHKMAEGTRCKFYNSGFCQFTNKCKFVHPKSDCPNESCRSKVCQLRHPKSCRYNDKCRRQTTCLYKHKSDEKKLTRKLNIEIEELKKTNLKLRN